MIVAAQAQKTCQKSCGSCEQSARLVHRQTCVVAGSLALSGVVLSFAQPGWILLSVLGGLLLVVSGLVRGSK